MASTQPATGPLASLDPAVWRALTAGLDRRRRLHQIARQHEARGGA